MNPLSKEGGIYTAQTKVMIAMSGGVDSSAAACLMQREGYACIGATLRLHDPLDSANDARAVAEKLNMPFQHLDATEEFRKLVMDHFVRSYEAGLTPNPCVECNRHLKFGLLLEKALEMDCQYIVTGHYCRIRQGENGRFLLYKASDPAKDQSYFLYSLTQHQLSHTLFPLADLSKEQVRTIAEEQGLLNAHKRDSQDICFIPDGDYFRFMQEFTQKNYPAGNFLDTDGNIVGQHHNAAAYTRGQRKGLGLAMGQPVYVLSKDMENNTVTVGENEKLFSTTLRANDWNFIPFDSLTTPLRVMAKARSRMIEQPATIYPEENGFARVVFDVPQRAITTGQAVVLYDGDMVIGGGTITEVL